MEEALLQLVRDIQDRKREGHISPTHSLKQEVFTEVANALNNLYLAGKIEVGDTINDKYIKVNE